MFHYMGTENIVNLIKKCYDITSSDISDLRETVGWNRMENEYNDPKINDFSFVWRSETKAFL